MSGTMPSCRDMLTKEQNGTENSCAISRKILLLSPSGPTAFPKGKELRTSSISEGVIIKELK